MGVYGVTYIRVDMWHRTYRAGGGAEEAHHHLVSHLEGSVGVGDRDRACCVVGNNVGECL